MSDPNDPRPTGPRTDEGKAVSSRNATTHGLTARQPLCEDEAERMIVLSEHWVAKHLPQTESEEALVRAAAMEYVRYTRCVRIEEALLRPGGQEALRQWQESRRHAVRRKAQELRDDPSRVAAELQETAFGIDWMLRHWRLLLDHLDAGRPWNAADLARGLNLLGHPASRPAPHDPDPARLWNLASRAFPCAVDAEAPHTLAPDDPDALPQLRALVTDQIDRLQTLRSIVWEEVDLPQAQAVESAALVDTTREGQLRHRYRRDALRDFQRSFSMVLNLRVERSKMDTRTLQQDRLAASSRSSSANGWFVSPDRLAPAPPPPPPRPAPPSSPSPPAASSPESAPLDVRNEPPAPSATEPDSRLNPNRENTFRNETPADASPPSWRTGPRPEAPRGPLDGPIGGPSGPPPGRIEPDRGV